MSLQAEAFQLKIPFRFSYDHNLAKRACGDSVILKITDEYGVEAYGEATPRSYVTGENSISMLEHVLQVKHAVLSSFDGTFDTVPRALSAIPNRLMSLRSLFESALLDYVCKKESCTLFDLFQVSKDKTIQYTASLTGGTDSTFNKMLAMYCKNKMHYIKLKVTEDLQTNLKRIEQIKQNIGPEAKIRMDGNAIWNFQQAKLQLPALIEAGVECFEQLFAKEDWKSNELCYRHFGDRAEFIVDESITDEASLQKVLEADYIDGANLKISKNGGIISCLNMAKKLRDSGKSIRLGAHVGETSSLTLAGMVFASLTDDLQEIEGAAGNNLLLKDPFNPCLSFGYRGRFDLDEVFRKNITLTFEHDNEMALAI